jgi:hypothetical protein
MENVMTIRPGFDHRSGRGAYDTDVRHAVVLCMLIPEWKRPERNIERIVRAGMESKFVDFWFLPKKL